MCGAGGGVSFWQPAALTPFFGASFCVHACVRARARVCVRVCVCVCAKALGPCLAVSRSKLHKKKNLSLTA